MIARLNTETRLIDTTLSLIPGPFVEVCRDTGESTLAALEDQPVMLPGRQAVISLAESSGYSVATLAPRFTDYAARSTALSAVPRPRRDPDAPRHRWSLRDEGTPRALRR
jgi:hypothetical protein